MTPPLLSKLLIAPVEAFLLATAALVAFRLVNGEISLRGLLIEPRTGKVSSLRVQKLLATIAVAGSFAAAIAAKAAPDHLPSVSKEMLLLLFGSNGVVLISRGFYRILAMARAPSTDEKDRPT